MLADLKDQTLAQNLYNLEGLEEKVNPFSVVMGANGSGKSSIFDALHFVKKVFMRRRRKNEKTIKICRNKLASDNMSSTFEVCFSSTYGSTKRPIQKYILEISSMGIVRERALFLENENWNEFWVHDFKPLPTKSKTEGALNVDWGKEKFSKIKRNAEMADIVSFFNNLFFFDSIDNNLDQYSSSIMSPYTQKEIAKLSPEIRPLIITDRKIFLSDFKQLLVNLFNALGVNVTDLGFKLLYEDTFLYGSEEQHEYNDSKSFRSIKDCNREIEEIEDQLAELDEEYEEEEYMDDDMGADVDWMRTYVLETLKYKNYEMPIIEESSGTKRLVKLAFTMLRGLLYSNELVFFIDEMDAGLHDALSAEVVKQFFIYSKLIEDENVYNLKKNSQLIITSHNTVLLRNGSIRKDQIWFAEMKEENRTTDLYSLADLKGVKSTEDFAENYLRGAYGAVPQRSFATGEENADE